MTEGERVQIRDARKRCFFIVDNVIVDHYASIIGPFPTLVYAALCRHADYSTRETHPSHDFLAKELAISRATVKRSITMLIQHRLIERKHRKSKSGDPDTNIYIILEPWGRVSQNPPTTDVMLSEGNTNEEVGSVRAEVGSVGTEGGVSQNRGVGSVRATNNTQLEQDSGNKKEDPPIVPQPTSRRKKKVASRPPDKLVPSEKLITWHAAEFPQYDLADAIESCLDHYRKKGEEASDYEAAVRNWFRSGHKYGTLKRASNTMTPRKPMSHDEVEL